MKDYPFNVPANVLDIISDRLQRDGRSLSEILLGPQTFRDKLEFMVCSCNGEEEIMSDKMTAEVMPEVIKALDAQAKELEYHGGFKYDQPADEYPAMMYPLIWLTVKPVVYKFLKKNYPQAWFAEIYNPGQTDEPVQKEGNNGLPGWRRGDKAQGKMFYVPGYNLLIYCHKEMGRKLLLGGLSEHFNDASTDITRQVISKRKFERLSPVEIKDDINSYDFIESYAIDPAYPDRLSSKMKGWPQHSFPDSYLNESDKADNKCEVRPESDSIN